MKYLEKALGIIEKLAQSNDIKQIQANIFLNLSSVHSLRNKHDIGLDYCSKSISILAELYNKILMNRNTELAEESEKDKSQVNLKPKIIVTDRCV